MTNKDKKIKSLKNGRKSKMLLLFLGMSFLFWMLIKLSREYNDVVRFKVNYVNLPEGKILQSSPSADINIMVRAYGFDLIRYHILKKKLKIDVQSIQRKKGSIYYQLTNNLLSQVEEQITSDIDVLSIQPDSLFFDLGIGKTKKIKVIPNIEIQYQLGYNLLKELKAEPEYVSISGPERLIDSIKEVRTENTKLTDVNSSIELTLPIISLDKSTNVTYSVNKVKVTGKVEKFTETKLLLPFEIKNLPKSFTITTFPDEVEVIFQIGLSDYNKINRRDFKVSCDYNRTLKDGLAYLIPEVISKPSIVSEIKIVPNQIEYLIKK